MTTPGAVATPPTTAPSGKALPAAAPAGPASSVGLLSVLSVVLSLLAVAILGFFLNIGVVSSVEHDRAQQVSYAAFRTDLSEATAPTGQVDREGLPIPLGTPVAVLDIPVLGLEREVVFEGTTGAVLRNGPGHRRSTVLPGQPGVSVLYGRALAYGGPFSGLNGLELGAQIDVMTGQGEHRYVVTGVRRPGDVLPPPPSVADGEGRLTLVSAGGRPLLAESLVYVDANLVTTAVPAPGLAFGSRSLFPSEEALGSDPTAWTPVALYLLAAAACALVVTWLAVRWGSRQAWIVAFPTMALLSTLASREIIRLLPNLI